MASELIAGSIMDTRIFLSGFGNVGQPFARLLLDRADLLAAQHGLRATLVGVADSTGSAKFSERCDGPAM